MKSLHNLVLRFSAISIATMALNGTLQGADTKPNAPISVRVINFKRCVEGSKQGKQDQGSFDALKKQMETSLAEKEKVLNEMATKFEDADYLDSLSPEAETELKRKFRALNQEYTTLQNQYYQTLNQTNLKIVQKLTEVVAKAAETVAKQSNFDLMLNDEACFYATSALDASAQVIVVMDQMFEKDAAEAKNGAPKEAAAAAPETPKK